jgi:hypothetical protein
MNAPKCTWPGTAADRTEHNDQGKADSSVDLILAATAARLDTHFRPEPAILQRRRSRGCRSSKIGIVFVDEMIW